MSSVLNPYISFRDTAREAMSFYQSVFGGEVVTTTFGEGGMPHDPAEADLIMHSRLITESGFVLMVSDTPATMEYTPGTNISISLGGEDEADLTRWWESLIVGATVTAPLMKAPWGDSFGMCTDRFGVPWMVNIAGAAA